MFINLSRQLLITYCMLYSDTFRSSWHGHAYVRRQYSCHCLPYCSVNVCIAFAFRIKVCSCSINCRMQQLNVTVLYLVLTPSDGQNEDKESKVLVLQHDQSLARNSIIAYKLLRPVGPLQLDLVKDWTAETIVVYLYRTCETHFILDEKCVHFNALCYANALYVFLRSQAQVLNFEMYLDFYLAFMIVDYEPLCISAFLSYNLSLISRFIGNLMIKSCVLTFNLKYLNTCIGDV